MICLVSNFISHGCISRSGSFEFSVNEWMNEWMNEWKLYSFSYIWVIFPTVAIHVQFPRDIFQPTIFFCPYMFQCHKQRQLRHTFSVSLVLSLFHAATYHIISCLTSCLSRYRHCQLSFSWVLWCKFCTIMASCSGLSYSWDGWFKYWWGPPSVNLSMLLQVYFLEW
jgi:hypothetical protein